jgi:hypothetical protein
MSQPFMPHPSSMLLGRRTFLGTSATAASTAALASLLGRDALAAPSAPAFPLPKGAVLPALHFAPRAKRVIYLFQSGGPSQIELLDPKPGLVARHGSELPYSNVKSLLHPLLFGPLIHIFITSSPSPSNMEW